MWLYEIYSVNSSDEYLCSLTQFNSFKQSNITYFSIIFNTLHNYHYQGERTQGEQVSGQTDPDSHFAMLDFLVVK